MVSLELEPMRLLDVKTILIIKSDLIYAEALRQLTLQVFPAAEITLATSAANASRALARRRFDLLVTGLETSLEGDMLDLLSSATTQPGPRPRVLAITTHREYRMLAALRALLVLGVFDSGTEPPARLVSALRTVADGEYYWSRSLLNSLSETATSQCLITRHLTPGEQLILSVIGDGTDDTAAAHELGLSPVTVTTVRRNLHRKLGAQHRGELMRIAAQHGFVRFTPSGVIRTGFGGLLTACQPRKIKRRHLTAA